MLRLLILIGCTSLVWGGSYPIKPFVIDGETVPSDGPMPVASIQLNGKHICGGAVLKPSSVSGASPDKKFILTAAQCVYGLEATPEKFSIKVGSVKLSGKDGVTVKAVKIHTHPKYDPFDILNDIAVIEVEKITDPNVPTLEVEEKQDDGMYGIAGWGKSTQEEQSSDDLKFVFQTVLSETECNAYKLAGIVTSNQLCAINEDPTAGDGKKGACVGDAGSPLMGSSLVGIASWGNGCAVGKPDVYTYAFPYLNDFIKPIIDAKAV